MRCSKEDLPSMDATSDEDLLVILDRERRKSTQARKMVLLACVDSLIRRRVYPAQTLNGNPTRDPYKMMEGWGAYWHIWKEPLVCPHCQADLRDNVLGPPFKREVGMVHQDRVSYFYCPDCKHTL